MPVVRAGRRQIWCRAWAMRYPLARDAEMSLDDSMVVDGLVLSRYLNATLNGLNNQPDLHMHRKF